MARIFDTVLCAVTAFLLMFSWTVYCLHDAKTAVALSSAVAICVGYLTFSLQGKRLDKKKSKGTRQKRINDFAMFLRFNCDNSALFVPMLCYYNYKTEILNFDSVIISKADRSLAVFCFETDSLLPQQLQQAVVLAKRNLCEKLTVFCNRVDSAVLKLANSQLPTRFVDAANTYRLFEEAEKLPDFPAVPPAKQHFLPQFAFNKKRFAWYLGGALFTLFISVFSYLKVYLLAWATALFLLALYSLFNKRYNRVPTDVRLD